jgi:sulfatase maturation enzyme AslB (radical SAM superfamily)
MRIWGDPLMCKDLLEMCKHIIDHSNATIHINTNGGLRSPSWWEKLGKYCGNRLLIYFDIDGINNEMHAKYRRGVELDKVLENMEAISNTPADVKAFIILFKHNELYTNDMINLAKMYGANECYVIKSDRFLVNNKFKFINEDGQEEFLEEMTRKDLSRHIMNSEWVDRAEEFVQSRQTKDKNQMKDLDNAYIR